MGRWIPKFPEMFFDERFYRPFNEDEFTAVCLVIFVFAMLIGYFLLRYRTRMKWLWSILSAFAIGLAAAVSTLYWAQRSTGINLYLAPLTVALLPPFVLMVIEGLRGRAPCEASEDSAITESWTLWLTRGRVIWALALAASLTWGWEWPVWVALLAALGSLAAIPYLSANGRQLLARIIGMWSEASVSGQGEPVDDMTEERGRVMRMMEDGKITPGEASELLGALAETHRVEAPQPATVTPQRRLMFVGAALLVVGLFLPWFSVDIGKEMNRAMGGMTQQMQQMMGNSGMQMPNMNFNVGGVQKINGGQVGHGLGWIVTVLGLTAALAPMLFAMRRHTERSLTLLCLIGGAVILLYVIAGGARHVSYGLVLAAAGFGIVALGGMREYGLLTGIRFQPAKTAEGAH